MDKGRHVILSRLRLHCVPVSVSLHPCVGLKRFPGRCKRTGLNHLQYQNSHKLTDCTNRQEKRGSDHTQSLFCGVEVVNERTEADFCKAELL